MNTEDTNEKFREIYKRYMPLMRMLAKNGGVPYDEIDDIVQETFAAYYSHYPLTWPDYKVKAMLIRIMKNRCVDYLRKRDCLKIICFDPVLMQDDSFASGNLYGRDNLSILMSKLEYQDVLEAMKVMREDWAQVIQLYVIEGRPMDEVSRILGISEMACRQRLCRGRKQLKNYLIQKEMSREEQSGRSSMENVSNTGEIPGNA